MVALPADASARRGAQAPRSIVLVFDGLRPDSLTPTLMPNLARLLERGVTFTRSRTGFPSQTMVGAGELFAGAYPERSGITGNDLIVPGGPSTGLDLKDPASMKKVADAYGSVIPTTSVFQALAGAGMTSAVIGKAGPPELAYAAGATWAVSTDSAQSRASLDADQLHRLVTDRAGQAPKKSYPDNPRSDWIAAAAIAVHEQLSPDNMVVWFTDPDATQHERGIGSTDATLALRQADAAAARILAHLQSTGQLDNTNIIVTSDHGFSSIAHADPNKDLAGILTAAGLTPSHVTAAGNQHVVRFATPPTEADLQTAREAISRSPFASHVRTVITNPRDAASDTRDNDFLTGGDFLQGTERSGDLYVVYEHTPGLTPTTPGTSREARPDGRAAGHGGLVWSDLNNTLAMVGPAFEHAARTSNAAGIVDIAPTLLATHGVTIPQAMQGRVLTEALRDTVPGVPTLTPTAHTARSVTKLGSRTITNELETERIGPHSYFVVLSVNEA